MLFDIMLKSLLSLAVGLIFWFWALLVFMVYAFMPINKMSHSLVFTAVAPVLYLVGANLLIKKLFKEKGWRKGLINFGITVGTVVLALFVIELMSRIVR